MTWTPTVRAQADPNAPAAPHTIYLPLIPGDTIKSKSGIHLGNRGSDWRSELFTLITGTVTGTWPAAVVVQSDQIFNFHRHPKEFGDNKCRIMDAYLKLTGEGEPYNAFKYLTAAINAGTKVIIRITPSPGNFVDCAAPGENHRLRTDDTPAGENYCDENVEGKRTADKVGDYRDILDMAQEMGAIYQLSVDEHKWPAENLYFEPANEPNYEWYQKFREERKVIVPHVDNKEAWIQMDDYFAALYDRAKGLNSELQILSPSIAQELYGEHYGLGTCNKLKVFGGNDRSGLDFMKKTFGYDIWTKQVTDPKVDGFAWHNYWRQGREMWLPPFGLEQSPPTLDDYCDVNNEYKPQTDHIFQYLSAGMQDNMSVLPTFITEADLKSPCQLKAFENTERKDDVAQETRASLLKFIEQEYLQKYGGYGAQYVIVWLLVNQYEDEEPACQNADEENNHNYEINWHEAYTEAGEEAAWFRLWWPATP